MALLAKNDWRLVDLPRSRGICHGERGLLLMVTMERLVRPEKNLGGMDVKLLVSRKIPWRSGRSAREGKGPDSLLFCRERVLREESVLRSGGREPERDLELRLMVTTRPDLHSMLLHLQGSGPDQPRGVGERSFASFCITEASSAIEREKKRTRWRRR